MVQYASPANLGHNLKYARPAIFDDTVVLCSCTTPVPVTVAHARDNSDLRRTSSRRTQARSAEQHGMRRVGRRAIRARRTPSGVSTAPGGSATECGSGQNEWSEAPGRVLWAGTHPVACVLRRGSDIAGIGAKIFFPVGFAPSGCPRSLDRPA